MRTVRAKFACHTIEEYGNGDKKAKLMAVYGTTGENKDFSDATPSGNLEIHINKSTDAIDFFKPGKDYFLTFEQAD